MNIEITIEGITPLMLNRFSDEAAQKATEGSGGSSSAAERGTPLDIARSKLYHDSTGTKLVIPQPNLLRCLVEGGRFHKAGKKQITTQRESMMFACFDIEGAYVEIIHKQPWKVDTRPVRIPSTGGRILGHRPMFDDWRLEFIVDLDTTIMGAKLLRAIIDDAGKRIGLGDFRPATKGPFGRFVVTRWQEVEQMPQLMAAE